jgi:hypothetical protein
MTSYATSDAERVFLTAVAAVFAEHREASARFGLCDVDRLTELFDRGRRETFGVRRDETGNVSAVPDERSGSAADAEEISPTFPASVQDPFAGPINPFTGEPEGACLVIKPKLTGGFSCIMKLTS